MSSTLNVPKGQLLAEIESARAALAQVEPAIEACRRPHNGLDRDWLEISVHDLVEVADALVAVVPSLLQDLAAARRAAVAALAGMARVVSVSAGLVLPLEACPHLHLPRELVLEWRSTLELLVVGVSAACERHEAELSREILERAARALEIAGQTLGPGGSRRSAVTATPALLPVAGPPPKVSSQTVAQALVVAQERAQPLAKDLRTAEGFAVASASSVILASKDVFSAAGLSLAVKSSAVVRLCGNGPLALRRVYVLRHALSGETVELEQEWPLGVDVLTAQNVAAASTLATKRALMDLLLLATRDDEEADGRRPAHNEGAAIAREVRDVIALLPAISQLQVEDSLARALGNLDQLRRLRDWARETKPRLVAPAALPASSAAERKASDVVSGDFLDSKAGTVPATPGSPEGETAGGSLKGEIVSSSPAQATAMAPGRGSSTSTSEGVVPCSREDGATPPSSSTGAERDSRTGNGAACSRPDVTLAQPVSAEPARPSEGQASRADSGEGRVLDVERPESPKASVGFNEASLTKPSEMPPRAEAAPVVAKQGEGGERAETGSGVDLVPSPAPELCSVCKKGPASPRYVLLKNPVTLREPVETRKGKTCREVDLSEGVIGVQGDRQIMTPWGLADLFDDECLSVCESCALESDADAGGCNAPELPAPTSAPNALELEVARLKKIEAEEAAKKAAAVPPSPPIAEAAGKAIRRKRTAGNKAPPPEREPVAERPGPPLTDALANPTTEGF